LTLLIEILRLFNAVIPDSGITPGNIRLFVNYKTKVAYCFVSADKLTAAQCALYVKDLSYLKVTTPSTWAIRLVIMNLEVGKPIVVEDRDALVVRVREDLPEGFLLVFNKERQKNTYMHSCTVMAPTFVSYIYFSSIQNS
jgi:hypothetical protein